MVRGELESNQGVFFQRFLENEVEIIPARAAMKVQFFKTSKTIKLLTTFQLPQTVMGAWVQFAAQPTQRKGQKMQFQTLELSSSLVQWKEQVV
jgi:hypothetical protein